jgi:hypothetical protein
LCARWSGKPSLIIESAEQKRHVIFEAGHTNFPRAEVIREVLGWLDRYLGPVDTAARP